MEGGAMRRLYFGPLQWHLLPPEPPKKAAFRRWNIIIFLILAFVVLGVCVAGVGSLVESKGVAAAGKSASHQQVLNTRSGI
jgi:heme/copper-type cytochrome/quinol oxidase subunit 2